jgi:hypothetical protein
MKTRTSLVWFEAGRPMPRYAYRNFELTHKLHENLEQFLLTDSKKEFGGIHTIQLAELPKSPETEEFEGIRKEWKHKQAYFWNNTTARFFYIYDLILTGQVSEVLHLESDTVLLSQHTLLFLESNPQIKFSFPMQANGIGCGSIMYIRDVELYRKFLLYILKNWRRSDVDDMKLLGEFAIHEKIFNLPTKVEKKTQINSLLFDAGSIGQHFIGSDARNSRLPFSKRGSLDTREGSISELLESDNFNFKTHFFTKGLKVTLRGSSVSLANVHIHSKFISSSIFRMKILFLFSFVFRIPILWKLGHLDKIVLAERFVSFYRRRILKRPAIEEVILR